MISSTNNATVRKVVKLRKARERSKRGLMLVEGHAAASVALDAGTPLVDVFHTPAATRRRGPLLARAKDSGARVIECSPGVMEHITGTDHPPDVVSVAPLRSASLAEAAAGDFPVVLSEIRDPAVAGGIMAAAAGAGATSVIATKGTADIFAPPAVRAAAGAHFVVPVASGQDSADVAAALGGKRLVALVPGGADVAEAGLKPPLALVVAGESLLEAFAGAERVSAGGSARGVGPGIGARAAIALEEARRGASP